MPKASTERNESNVRVSDVEASLHRALADCIGREPDLTWEEIGLALLRVAGDTAERLRRGQS